MGEDLAGGIVGGGVLPHTPVRRLPDGGEPHVAGDGGLLHLPRRDVSAHLRDHLQVRVLTQPGHGRHVEAGEVHDVAQHGLELAAQLLVDERHRLGTDAGASSVEPLRRLQGNGRRSVAGDAGVASAQPAR
ncbi:hypothetical protein [Nocardioides alcanivorans]|uniref:hypothetical protein n=1 Tax=Nocardioides alcanivorans TaxID=2897352 RepID=UPI001F2662FF|nr:hypothetical protein [Nocardioides alcanivorans]